MKRPAHDVLVLVAALLLPACATWQAPDGVDEAMLRTRAVTETAHDVRVRATLLDAVESHAMFGSDIDKADVQPVWLEVENRTSQTLWLLRTGADPEYFSPHEVAWAMHRNLSRETNARIDAHVASLAFVNPIGPGATHAGIIFTNPQRGTVLLNLDLFASKTLKTFSLFLWRDQHGVETSAPQAFRYPEAEITDYRDLDAFRQALARLPCCATQADGTTPGEPLNVVLVGTMADVAAAIVRRNLRIDRFDHDATQRVFGRAPDSVWRHRAQADTAATWIRLWAAPMRFDGKLVFVAQVGRPIGGRFAARDASDLALYEDVDEARNLLVQDMMYSGGLEKLGFAAGVGDRAGYRTDGLRAVMFFATRPLNLSDVELLDWEPFLERREAAPAQGGDAHD